MLHDNCVIVLTLFLALVGIYFAYKKKAWESIITFILSILIFFVGIGVIPYNKGTEKVGPDSSEAPPKSNNGKQEQSKNVVSNSSNGKQEQSKDVVSNSSNVKQEPLNPSKKGNEGNEADSEQEFFIASTNSETFITDLVISEKSERGSVLKTKLAKDIFDNVYRNCYALGWEDFSGGSEAYIEFVLNKKYKSFSVTLVVPRPTYEGDLYRMDVYVEIMNDSKVIYTSPTLNQKTQAIDVVLDVSNQNFLRVCKKPRSLVAVLLADAKVSK